ncbi:MAG: hypothetical protein Q4C45_08595 [Oscillospiraceae bacterium]|nr:hypothetical protein [Oscillospiraceae bacterium]
MEYLKTTTFRNSEFGSVRMIEDQRKSWNWRMSMHKSAVRRGGSWLAELKNSGGNVIHGMRSVAVASRD